ncbi:MAG: hypothetical protein H6574_02875 [Lewinellaceae bacterium]|nr:hypothetical protein [Saprospiraceae bacterium]MCB9330000.1 hypothetical protein [Lewinellaceae bacterium]
MKNIRLATLRAALSLFIGSLSLTSTVIAQTGTAASNGGVGIPACLTEIPLPPLTAAEAAHRSFGADLRNPNYQALDNFYQANADRIGQILEVQSATLKNRLEVGMAGQDEATMRAQTMAMANQNSIVAAMGGAENVAKMTPEQAEAAAREAATSYMADPFAASGVQSDGMTALYQKIISDPAYAARFEKMSEQERGAELRKFMANDKPQVKTVAQQQQEKQQLAKSGQIQVAMAFQQQHAELQHLIMDANNRFAEQRTAILTAPGGHSDIDAAYQKKYAAIPEIVMGEGREKDPDKLQKLNREVALEHKVLAEKLLKRNQMLLTELQDDYQRIMAGYAGFYAMYGPQIDSAPVNPLNSGADAETAALQCEMTLSGLVLSLIDQAKEITREAAEWERNLMVQ